ncbi:unnamed protein product [Penicillium manginii]
MLSVDEHNPESQHLSPLQDESDKESESSDSDNRRSGARFYSSHFTESPDIPLMPSPTPPEESFFGEVRRYPKITLYTIGLAIAFLLGGYDSVIVNTVPSISQFQKDFGVLYGPDKNEYIIPSMWLSLWSALGAVGQILGALVSPSWQDRSGRRIPMVVGTVVSAAAVAVIYTSYLPTDINARRAVFLIGEIIQGLGVGVLTTTAQTYISETVPTSLRGSAMALCPTFVLLGQLIGALVVFMTSGGDTSSAYLVTFVSMWPFSAITLLIVVLVPESPAFLVRNGRLVDAHRALQKLHSGTRDCAQLVKDLQKTDAQEKEENEKIPWRDCFRRTDLRRTLIVSFVSMMPCFFGFSLLSNASYFLQIVGMDDHNSLMMFVLGISLGLVANAVGVWVANVVGRRTLILSSLSVTSLLWLGMGIAGCWSGVVSIWYTAVTMMFIVVICGVGAWPASFAVVGETSSLRLRAKSQGISTIASDIASILFSFLLPYVYNKDAGNLGAKTGFLFFVICTITTAITWLTVPELKGRTNAEIDHMFKLGLPTRRFRSWSAANGTDDSEVLI